jgi:hypothetical protein
MIMGGDFNENWLRLNREELLRQVFEPNPWDRKTKRERVPHPNVNVVGCPPCNACGQTGFRLEAWELEMGQIASDFVKGRG